MNQNISTQAMGLMEEQSGLFKIGMANSQEEEEKTMNLNQRGFRLVCQTTLIAHRLLFYTQINTISKKIPSSVDEGLRLQR